MNLVTPYRVTFIGIGAIGLPMAERILDAGFDVIGVDPFESPRTKAAERGITAEATSASAGEADIVVVMVATPDQLRESVLGNDGVLWRMRHGSVLMVMSTVGPEVVRDIEAAAPLTVRVLDIPVTGGVAGAVTGNLKLFASGNPESMNIVQPVLDTLGTTIDCGPEVGQGQAYKAVNQLLCSVHIVAAAEALALAEKLGLDPEKVLPAVASGAGASWMLSDRGPRMQEGPDAEVTSAIGIFVKDSTLVKDIADKLGFDAPMISAAQAKYLAAAAAGLERSDDSQVIATYRQ